MDKIIKIIRKNVRVIGNVQGNLMFYKLKTHEATTEREIKSIDLNYAKYLFDIGGEEELIKTITNIQ